MPTLEVYDSPQIKLDLALKKNELQNITVKGIEREAYYSKEENRLYILTGTKLLSGIVAKELSRIFKTNSAPPLSGRDRCDRAWPSRETCTAEPTDTGTARPEIRFN